MNIAADARRFSRSTYSAVLSTLSARFDGCPFGSVAPFVLDHDGSPVILISTLAEHTKNITANPKVSLLVLAGLDDLQSNARLTLMGEAQKVNENNTHLRARYLRYFPSAAEYFGMHDFSFYRIHIKQARFIGGFGNIAWVDAKDFASPANQLAEQEADILAHMNTDHAPSLLAYCKHFHEIEAGNVEMLGIDTDGFDVQADKRILRFDFKQPVTDALSARTELVALSRVVGQ
jgi:putative heme iron utilization protein